MIRDGASQLNWLNAGAVCLNFNLRRTSRAVTQYYDEALKPTGVKVTQFTILMAIASQSTGRSDHDGQAAIQSTGGARGRSGQDGQAAIQSTGGARGRSGQDGQAA
ncbi:MAG: hypothetical protein ACOY5B_14610, partial [Spirochaetota bacterium]